MRGRVRGRARGRGRIKARVSAFLACVTLVTSCSTMPPYEWMASFTSCRAPSEVMTTGTLCLTHLGGVIIR